MHAMVRLSATDYDKARGLQDSVPLPARVPLWQPYDDTLYLRSPKGRNPILYQLALTTKLPREENSA